ncbi:MAG: biopolymer transporter ExbD [Deltaproteobacteria bacterium]|nr:biopolymer transporter ExbD [Deltaproteobacteria bacterium]
MNVTPLVDVVLVLLIIFMVLLPERERLARVELPEILNVDPAPKSRTEPFILSLTRQGEMYFEKERLAFDAFTARLRAASRREPHRKLILRADRAVRYAILRCGNTSLPED